MDNKFQKGPSGPYIDPAIAAEALWANERLQSLSYGRINLEFVVHEGRITRVIEGIADNMANAFSDPDSGDCDPTAEGAC